MLPDSPSKSVLDRCSGLQELIKHRLKVGLSSAEVETRNREGLVNRMMCLKMLEQADKVLGTT